MGLEPGGGSFGGNGIADAKGSVGGDGRRVILYAFCCPAAASASHD